MNRLGRLWDHKAFRLAPYTLVLLVLAALFYHLSPARPGTPPRDFPLWLYALIYLAATRLTVELHFTKEPTTMSASDMIGIVGLVAIPAPELIITTAAMKLLGHWISRRPRPVVDVFNFVYSLFLVSLMVFVYYSLGPVLADPFSSASVLALGITLAVDALVGTVTFTVAVALATGSIDTAGLLPSMVYQLAAYVVGAALGSIALLIYTYHPWLSFSFAPLLLVVVGAQRAAAASARSAQRFKFMYQTSQLLQATNDLTESAQELLSGLASAFSVEQAELLLPMAMLSSGAESAPIAGASIGLLLRATQGREELSRETRSLTDSEVGVLSHLSSERPLLSSHVDSDVEALTTFTNERNMRTGAVALVATPRHQWGALSLMQSAGTRYHRIGRADAEMLSAVAGEIALALELGKLDESIRSMSAQRAELELRVVHDALTGLGNRVLFLERLERSTAAWRRYKRQFAVAYIDLDGFKPVNDTWGHAAGDSLLQQVGGRLTSALRDPDCAVRLGGDEFAVIIDDLTEGEDAIAIIDRILASVRRPYQVDGGIARVSASIGVAMSDLHWDAADEGESLVQHADEAMYAAKSAGKDRYCIYGRDTLHIDQADEDAASAS